MPLLPTLHRSIAFWVLGILLACLQPASAVNGAGPIDIGAEHVLVEQTAVGPITYTPGRGLTFGRSGLLLGGYTNLTVTRDEGDPARFAVDDLSLFVRLQLTSRIHVFSELEVENVLEADDTGHAGNPHDRFTVERLYGDLMLTDALTIRGGTFLTPVGRWNILHAAPLVWTTSRPRITDGPFDPRGTGIMLYGSVFPAAGPLTYQVYGHFAQPPEGNPDFDPDDDAFGARVDWLVRPELSIGASHRTSVAHGHWQTLGGIDFLWRWQRLELQAESLVGERLHGLIAGGYLQGAFELWPRLYLVARYEHTDGPRGDPGNLVTQGLLLRWLPNAVFKVEYQAAFDRSPYATPGFRASAAMLF